GGARLGKVVTQELKGAEVIERQRLLRVLAKHLAEEARGHVVLARLVRVRGAQELLVFSDAVLRIAPRSCERRCCRAGNADVAQAAKQLGGFPAHRSARRRRLRWGVCPDEGFELIALGRGLSLAGRILVPHLARVAAE